MSAASLPSTEDTTNVPASPTGGNNTVGSGSAPVPMAKPRRPIVASSDAPEQMRGLFNFLAENDDELGFRKGDVITIVKKEDEGWWTGELDGRTGIFPSNYVGPL